MAKTLDTYQEITHLTDIGVDHKHAEAFVNLVSQSSDELATKADLQLLKADINLLKADLTNRMYAIGIANLPTVKLFIEGIHYLQRQHDGSVRSNILDLKHTVAVTYFYNVCADRINCKPIIDCALFIACLDIDFDNLWFSAVI